MKANPGGQIDPKDVIGRDTFISQIWEILAVQSIYMNAERRIGKSTVMRAMVAAPRVGWHPIYRDFEGIHSAADFAQAVYRDIVSALPDAQRRMRKTWDFIQSLGGTEVGGVLKFPEGKSLPWKTVLEKSCEDLHAAAESSTARVLFLWDEIPFMLDNIRKREGEQTAMEILDVLRAHRQTYASLRLVVTGSIGLHHVLGTLKKAGYANAPFNDCAAVEIGPLAPLAGQQLALRLIDGEAVPSSDPALASARLSELADHFPYYIHHLVRRLKFARQPAEPAAIEQILQAQLVDAGDPWELLHYRTRIPTYYGPDERLALTILDCVALTEPSIGLTQLFNEVKSTMVFDDKEKLRNLLVLLERDHYLRRTATGEHHFAFPLIRRWWRLHRGL